MLYPDAYLKNIKEITIEFLKKNDIKAIIFDVDNTLIDFDRNMLDGTQEWCEELKKEKIKFCILSNSEKKDKVKTVAEKLDRSEERRVG